MEDVKLWHEQYVQARAERVVVKKRNRDGSFDKSIIIPTVMYPLSGKPEVFSCSNTSRLPEKYHAAINKVAYKIGFCYQNAGEIRDVLREAGAAVETYAGWIFVGATEFPAHHCWCVVDGKSVVDLADDYWLLLNSDHMNKPQEGDKRTPRERIADAYAEIKDLPNSLRCAPVGIPAPNLLYVGCPCEPEEARKNHRDLMKKFPDHEIKRTVDGGGLNRMQRTLLERGLM